MKFSVYNPSDINEIIKMFIRTFSDSENESEGLLIGNLVNDLLKNTDGRDIYCFTAIENNRIIGSIIFSKLIFEIEVKAFLLSPVAICTNYQKKGIGQQLIKFGLDILKKDKIELIFTYGDINFYSKTGFELVEQKTVKAPLKLTYPKGWLGLSLNEKEIKPITGNSNCVDALNNSIYW